MSDSFMTPRTVACQAPLSMSFPRQEYWNGLSLPSPGDLPNRDWTRLLRFRVGYLSLSHRGARPLFLWLLLNKIHKKLKHNTSKPRLTLIPKLFVPPLVPISVKRPPSTKVFKLETWGTCLTALLPNLPPARQISSTSKADLETICGLPPCSPPCSDFLQ